MRLGKRSVALLALGGTATAAAAVAIASPGSATDFTHVANANTKSPGYAPPVLLSPELQQIRWAQGSSKLENGTPQIPYYGYLGDGPMVPPLGSAVEATKTEPDKNTYLTIKNGLKGADASYDYGTHFLFQGHEGGAGYFTRVNLDADAAHRVTLLADRTSAGVPLKTIDGSTWDPFSQRLLFSNEGGSNGTIYQSTLDVPAAVDDLGGQLGREGFEGIQNDDRGNVYLVADTGGQRGALNPFARQPNSFLYRVLPKNVSDLKQGGTIQALQVIVSGKPLTFTAPASSLADAVKAAADADISGANSAGYVALHTYGTSYPTKWIDLVTTDSATPLPGPDLNALAKAKGATPFKRPENAQFRPGSKFGEYYFDETGDTDSRTSAAATGGFAGVFKLLQSPSSNDGRISIFYNGDIAHAGFDNVAFFSKDKVAFGEDAGDTLHTQRNALDSAYMFDVTQDYSHGLQPVRFIAQGRDPSATIDSGLGDAKAAGNPLATSFRNDGDNEITGVHVSDGDPSMHGILGAKVPQPFRPDGAWRAFYSQQHGDNVLYELLAAPKGASSDRD